MLVQRYHWNDVVVWSMAFRYFFYRTWILNTPIFLEPLLQDAVDHRVVIDKDRVIGGGCNILHDTFFSERSGLELAIIPDSTQNEMNLEEN